MRRERAPMPPTATPSLVWPVNSRLLPAYQRLTSWRSLNAGNYLCEPAWNSMTKPPSQSLHDLDLGMKLKAARKQSKLALFARNHDRACLVPART